MKPRAVFYSSHFALVFKKLPKEIRQKTIEQEKIFRKDCFDPRLKTHKLKGALSGYWAFSVDYSYRILFEFLDDGSAGFIDIGQHSVYR